MRNFHVVKLGCFRVVVSPSWHGELTTRRFSCYENALRWFRLMTCFHRWDYGVLLYDSTCGETRQLLFVDREVQQ